MFPAELQALRRLVFYSIEDAACFLAASPDRPAGVEPRSWQAWERGDRRIPDDVIAALQTVVSCRAHLVAHYEALAAAPAAGPPRGFAWFHKLDDWTGGPPGRDVPAWFPALDDWHEAVAARAPALWRPHCAALADVHARYPAVRLVGFEPREYAAWLARGNRAATPTLPDEWACAVLAAGAA